MRYSQENLGSTARSFAIGGAMGAVGADPSCAAINPAGLGRYRTSKFYFSTAFFNAKNNTSYLGSEISSNKFNFNLPNVGFVINIPGEDYEEKKPKGFVNFVLAFNVNRLNNFHKNTTLDGSNVSNSITQNWAERGTGIMPDYLSKYSLEYLAYNAYLTDSFMNPSTNEVNYRSAYGSSPINVNQSANILSKGTLNDYNVSFAANYRHLFQGGISLGFKSVRYIESGSFIETDLKKGTVKDIYRTTFDQELKTKGTGFNAKLGFIVTPSEYFRFGYSFHSPTTYNLKDSYEYVISSVFDNGAVDANGGKRESSTLSTDITGYKYKITTPARHVLSVAMVNKEVGFLSMDLEYVNYTEANLYAKDYKFVEENRSIRKNYNGGAWNLRLGGELVQDKFRFRAGYARYPSPYTTSIVPDLRILVNNIYTAGFGIKTDNYSFDVAYVNSGYSDYHIPYTLSSGKHPTATNNVRTSNLVFTVGLNLD